MNERILRKNMFIFKQKEIVIDAFTAYKEVYDLFPLDHSYKFIPEWWKNIPKNLEIQNPYVDSVPYASMKHCYGIIEYFKNGFMLPMWSDVKIKTSTESYSFQFATSYGNIQQHKSIQYNDAFPDYQHAKFMCPWYFKTKQDIKFLCSAPIWNLNNHWQNLFILPGIVEFKFNNVLHVNMFLKKQNEQIFIEAGTPIFHISPITDKKIKIVNHLVSESELLKQIDSARSFFVNHHLKIKKIMQRKHETNS